MNRIYTIVLPAFLLLIPVRLHSRPVIIEGNAPSYAGSEIPFFRYVNLITYQEEELGRCVADDSGSFSMTVDIDKVTLLFSHLGVYDCHFYAEPGKHYDLKLPAKRDKSAEDRLNPYFEPVPIHLHVRVRSLKTGDTLSQAGEELNFLIRSFNDSFYPYYFKHVVEVNSRGDIRAMDEALSGLKDTFGKYEHPFFRDYILYKEGLLRHLSRQQKTQAVYNNYFRDRPVLYNNPAYMELFNQIFDKYFSFIGDTQTGVRIRKAVNNRREPELLISALLKDDLFNDRAMAEFIVLKGLYDAFYDAGFSRSGIIGILKGIAGSSGHPEHRSIARSIEKDITSLLAGYEAPGFELLDPDSSLWRLADFKNQYIYLNFCNTKSYSCHKDLELLAGLHEKYREKLCIMTVFLDKDFKDMSRFLENKNYDWVFLHYGHDPGIIERYDIRGVPTYYLIGPEQQLLLSPSPSPLENFESCLFKIMNDSGDPGE